MTDPVGQFSEYLWVDTLDPPGNCRGDKRIPVAGIGEITDIVFTLIEGWNK